MRLNSNTGERLKGAGPWSFSGSPQLRDLDTMESARINFDTLRYNNRDGWFRRFLPLTDLQVTNQSNSNTLEITVNDSYSDTVLPNQIETFPEAQVVSVKITNVGSTTVTADEIAVTVSKEGYDADEAAREEKTEGFASRALSDLVPGL